MLDKYEIEVLKKKIWHYDINDPDMFSSLLNF